jgi:hypothetical protein
LTVSKVLPLNWAMEDSGTTPSYAFASICNMHARLLIDNKSVNFLKDHKTIYQHI